MQTKLQPCDTMTVEEFLQGLVDQTGMTRNEVEFMFELKNQTTVAEAKRLEREGKWA